MPASVRLSARRLHFHRADAETLGAKLELRRRELGLTRVEAGRLLGCDPKTVMWWERNERPPFVQAYPAIIDFIGCEPWAEPSTLAAALVAERRRRGLEIRKAAALVGVDEGTWRRWEQGQWKPRRLTVPAIDELLGLSVAHRYPADVR